ncbi:MAG: hypothetical protein WC597_06375 [Brevundimonas sp.]
MTRSSPPPPSGDRTPAGGPPAAKIEQRLLLLSTAATVILAIAGVAVGLWSGARAIVFDGMFNVVDAAMTLTAVGRPG